MANDSVFSKSSIRTDLLGAALIWVAATWLLTSPTPAGAQGAGTLDHFRVYPNAAGFGLDGPIVQIDDQFGTQQTDLGRPIQFMVPVDKNDEGMYPTSSATLPATRSSMASRARP